MALDDSLKLALTAAQKARLTELSNVVAVKADKIAEELADVLTSAGVAPDPQVIGARMQGKTSEARAVAEESVADLQKVLTAEQWAKLPESVRVVPPDRGLGGFGGGGDGGGGRGGRGPGGF